MEEEIVQAEDSNTAEEVVLETAEQADSSETVEEESVDEVKARLEKSEELARNYKIRAEKAEKQAKEKVETKVETPSGLSSRDTIAIINAKVHEDDIEEVLDYAKFKKISVSEALKSGVVKASLAERNEQRSTANATSTGRTRSGIARASGESLLSKAQKTGEIPDSDEALAAMIDARRPSKR